MATPVMATSIVGSSLITRLNSDQDCFLNWRIFPVNSITFFTIFMYSLISVYGTEMMNLINKKLTTMAYLQEDYNKLRQFSKRNYIQYFYSSTKFAIRVRREFKVRQIKRVLTLCQNVPVNKQRLIFCGQYLQDDQTIGSFDY